MNKPTNFEAHGTTQPIMELGKPTQIGILVNDARRTAGLISMLTGIGPWRFEDWPPPDRPEWVSYVDGQSTQWRALLAFATCGSLEIELIETYEGECGYTDFVRRRGQGLHHVQFQVGDVEQAARNFEDNGIGVKMSATGRRPGTKWILLDTEGLIGFGIEISTKQSPA